MSSAVHASTARGSSAAVREVGSPERNTVLDAVRPHLPSIGERARKVDESRRIPSATMRELGRAGVFRMLQPARFGGAEAHPAQFYEVVRAIAAECGSTGWVTSILGIHPWHVGLFDEHAQREVWGEDADTRICSSYAPVGTLVPVDDGYELSGRWMFASGCDYASWALLGAMVLGAEGRPVDFMTVLVPKADYRVHDVWDVVGMRGTASNEIVVADAFVPAHRVIRNYDTAQLTGPGQAVNTGPLYRLPFATMFTTAVAMPILGVVSGCYERYLRAMRERTRLSLGGGRFVEDPFAQAAVARASSDIDASLLQLERNVAALWDLAQAREPLPMALRLRVRRDQVLATERALSAIDVLFRTAGGTSLGRGNPIERAWRDAHAGATHVANEPDRALALYGRGAFGLPIEDNLV
ncbi:3-hydroxy-9,10-secoandrosta-1,3,5(10)-triene-9,17-dione monooxygenase oxygenase subunit [Rhodococcus sp. HNM0569]|uniref:3-hydroxy-9,10-secoandrosta-1,3,5(10)-triene-9, 17-dione monooxygenase oxygenase subunit n=1 Tax=Rhodococcus sp. HNM0569 TaxID=2716340 RepID=UPI00146B8040|nr:3-hydroxy-9,10-secoandrosta-1,3,5(10)-triene-9,17-dione monooxygenase oxygenase subunit [Rhodococcus sp. HNM0569]NLU81651.1 flavin-dependent monooxygenase [Rhodococcus sp. HNM0569]